jgi:hypothetical protein
MKTPEFKGTKLFDRLCWAKENLEPVQSDYRVVFETDVDSPASILVADPNWMAAAKQGGILPPVWVYWLLAADEAHPDFKKHTRGYLLHDTQPIGPLTEEQAIEYLIYKDVPRHVWENYNKGNKPNLIICNKSQLPKTREWRNAWSISDEVVSGNKETVQSIEYQETEGLDLTEMFSEELNRSKVYA